MEPSCNFWLRATQFSRWARETASAAIQCHVIQIWPCCLVSRLVPPCGRRGFSEVEGMKSESRQTAATTDFGRGREDTKRKEKRRGRSKRWLRELFYKWQTDRPTDRLAHPTRPRSLALASTRLDSTRRKVRSTNFVLLINGFQFFT